MAKGVKSKKKKPNKISERKFLEETIPDPNPKESADGKRDVSPLIKVPPFWIDINDATSDEGCSINLLPILSDNFKDVEFTLKISRNSETKQPQYEIFYVNKPSDTVEKLEPFTAIDLDAFKPVTIVPTKKGGQTGFSILNEETKEEKPLGAPHFVHLEPSNGKHYLLDVTKFKSSIFVFKDPETEQEVTLDITKRWDPITGQPLQTSLKEPVYLGQFRNGEVYVLKDEKGKDIQVMTYDGRPALGYSSTFNSTTETTTILDDQGNVLTTLSGDHSIESSNREQNVVSNKQDTSNVQDEGDYLMVPEYPDTEDTSRENIQESILEKQVRFSEDQELMTLLANQEKYFENLHLEEGFVILDEVRDMEVSSMSHVLDVLIQVIEFEKNFINYALNAKIHEERSFIQRYLREKEIIQNKFIFKLLNSPNDNNIDAKQFKQRVEEELHIENEIIFAKLNEKICNENNLLIESLKKEIHNSRDMVVRKSNKKCYQSFKRITYRYLSEKLELEVKLIKREVAINLKREREVILNEIDKKFIT